MTIDGGLCACGWPWPHILLTDWTWIALDYLAGRRWLTTVPAPVWVFHSRLTAERARRTYGRGAWRNLEVRFVWPTHR